MLLLGLCTVLVCYINGALSGITTKPGMQRRYLGQSATFQWSVTGSLSDYSVYNLVSERLNANANYTLDSQNGVVTLTISNIQLADAGNYSLSITIGTTVQTDSGALLFVYGIPTIIVNQTSGGSVQQQAIEGDRVELTCTANSTSLPSEYRTRMYYQWYLPWIDTLQNISSGPARPRYSDDPIPGYSIKDDGRTLVIASAQYRDTQGIRCYGQEQWSPYQNSGWFNFPLKYRPYITTRNPPSKKFNAVKDASVSIFFYASAVPAITSATNWSFVNSAGYEQELPIGFSYSNSLSSPFSLTFTLTSNDYFGNYSINLTNPIGSTAERFQVLRPGPPDSPSSVNAEFVSHYLIAIAWNCMWSNGLQQTTFLELRALYNHTVVDSWNTIVYDNCFDATYSTQFENGIHPEADYEVRIWSTNDLGSSNVTKLTLRTPKIFRFFVSSRTISINGNQAIVNFSATESKIARLEVTYCLELTGSCNSNYYYHVNSTIGQIHVTFDNVLSGDVYIFDFMVYGGSIGRRTYYLTMVKGVRVTRNGAAEVSLPECDKGKANSLQLYIPVIVLGVLLGVAVLALIGVVIAFLVFKRRQNKEPINLNLAQRARTTENIKVSKANTERINEAFEEDNTYEAIEEDHSKDDTYYTALEGQYNS